MRKECLVVALIFTLILSGCVEMEKTRGVNRSRPVITANITPKPPSKPFKNLTYKPEPTPTLPPFMATPIPPGLIVSKFIEYYNERDAEKIYDLFSEKVKANHPLNDTMKELEFAERHNITVMPREDLLGKLWHIEAFKITFKVNLTLKSNESVTNETIDFPLIYTPYTEERNGYTIVSETGYIDGWVFDEILRDSGS